MTLILQLLGVRRYGEKIAGRLCLSFFATIDGLNISEIALDGGDPYLATWVKYLSPILDKNGTYWIFVEKNKHWVIGMEENFERNRRYLIGGGKFSGHNSKGGAWESIVPNVQDNGYSEKKDYSGNQNYFDRKTTWLGNGIEWMLKTIFLRYTERSYRKAGSPWGVIISEKYLKFHPNDRRREVQDKVLREGK
jgi:hypothetical protein